MIESFFYGNFYPDEKREPTVHKDGTFLPIQFTLDFVNIKPVSGHPLDDRDKLLFFCEHELQLPIHLMRVIKRSPIFYVRTLNSLSHIAQGDLRIRGMTEADRLALISAIEHFNTKLQEMAVNIPKGTPLKIRVSAKDDHPAVKNIQKTTYLVPLIEFTKR